MGKTKYQIKNTLGMFDLLKGLVMITVIMAHTYGFFDFLHPYATYRAFLQDKGVVALVLMMAFELFGDVAMPLLFIVSGYGMRKTKFKKCVKKQYDTLIVPYLITMAVTMVLYLLAYFVLYGGVRKSIKETIKLGIGFLFGMTQEATYFGHTIGICGPVWFMIALFIGIVVFNTLLNYFDGIKLILVSMAVAVVGWVLSLGITIPWAISQGLIAVWFLCCGYYVKKKKILTSPIDLKTKLIMICCVVVPVIIAKFFDDQFNMALNSYSYGPVLIFVYGIFGLFVIYLFLHLNRFNGKITGFLRSIGRYSLYLICIHTIELMSGGGIIAYNFVTNWQGSMALRNLIVFGVRLVIDIAATFAFVWIKDAVTKKLSENKK